MKKNRIMFSYFTEIFKKRSCKKQFNQLYLKKGDPTHQVKLISIESSNDGQGLHSI